VTGDEVRRETAALQFLADARDGEPVLDGGIEVVDKRVNARRRTRRRVDDLADAVELTLALLGDEDDLVPRGRQTSRGMYILTRKVLMDEEPVHDVARLVAGRIMPACAPAPTARNHRAAAPHWRTPRRSAAAATCGP
jgi:hypothetical protein